MIAWLGDPCCQGPLPNNKEERMKKSAYAPTRTRTMPSPEEKIRSLSTRVTDTEDLGEFHNAVEELKAALRERVSAVRQNAKNALTTGHTSGAD
jgi:hypothetical protein